MAGHSKWANIKHKKAKEDKKRGKIFTKLIREITVSARMGGGDSDANPRLRAAVMDAMANNMPKDTVKRAVDRGAGAGGDGANIEEILYEGYGAGGVAVMVYCMSDNRNRTVSEVRHAFTKCGGNLGTDGSVAYLFNKTGLIVIPAGVDEDRLMEVAIEAGADDVTQNSDGTFDVMTVWESVHDIKANIEAAGVDVTSAEVAMLPTTQTSVDKDTAEKILKLLDILDDVDDVQEVFSNADISDEVLQSLMD